MDVAQPIQRRSVTGAWAITLVVLLLVPGTSLYVARTDGSEVWEVPNTADAYDPAWRPE